ncbi:MAG TPA: metalloregulator ArsR/SmtB family transcription factor [Candidatus Baltobacteraceae bacterium]|nr:metalloregulator ArsR/SmtB family transcription factor [Candidatus Baltobacteraceae bacterium]
MRSFKADLFKTLAHPLRIRILDALRAAELTVGELTRQLGAEQSSISQHLAALRAKDLVRARREGTSVWYSVPYAAVWQLLDIARDVYELQVHDQQAALEATT